MNSNYGAPGVLALEALQIIFNEEEGLKKHTVCNFLFKLNVENSSKEQLIEIKELAEIIEKVYLSRSFILFPIFTSYV